MDVNLVWIRIVAPLAGRGIMPSMVDVRLALQDAANAALAQISIVLLV